MQEEADGSQAGLPTFSDDLLDGRALMGHEDYAMWSMNNRGYEATQGHPPRNVPSTEDDDDVMNEYVLKRFRDTAEHDFLVGTQARTGGRFKGMSLMRVDEVLESVGTIIQERVQPQLFGGGATRVAWIVRRLDGQLVVCRAGTQHVQYAVCPPQEHYQGLLCSQGNRQ